MSKILAVNWLYDEIMPCIALEHKEAIENKFNQAKQIQNEMLKTALEKGMAIMSPPQGHGYIAVKLQD